uniref:Baseplate J-like protein n=1 Tax=Candidatus Kentrum sp. TUN TaxID=2126343 RepID=A0A451A6G2_9GAMM|nr:MAG: Baseplate J-like protein [Candidatus Kentron sp. TUN]
MGRPYGVDRLVATAAAGEVSATGVNGTQLLAETLLRGPNGLDYEILTVVALGDGDTPVSVCCVDTGSNGNLIEGQTLTLIDPVPGCDNTMTVGASGLMGGAEEESVDDWRIRVADEWNVVVTRGARSDKPDDFRFWAQSAHPSVTSALIQMHVFGLGTVVVRPSVTI